MARKFDERRWKLDRHSQHQWAKRLMEQRNLGKVIILDTETTDLDGEVIELAMIDISGEILFNQRFKPLLIIQHEAEKTHGLTAELLANEPDFSQCYERIRAIIESANLVVIYNAAFDEEVLDRTCKLRQLPPLPIVSECVMKRYAAYKGNWNHFRGDYQWQKLPAGDHSALGDCQAALVVIEKMAERP